MKDMEYFYRLYTYMVPKGILARFALIICAPIIICELVTIYIFYEKVWFNISAHTSKMISNQIKLVLMESENGDLTKVVKYSQLFNVHIEAIDALPKIYEMPDRTEISILSDILRENFSNFQFIHHETTKPLIVIYFAHDINKCLKISIPSKPLLNPTAEIFILWILGVSTTFLIVAMAFAKNQIRSIEELSEAANSFGSKITLNSPPAVKFKPSGATEIRRAGIAFIKMQDRIRRQMKKRLHMLASISHDLRTPLTRMILQIELMEANHENQMLKSDLDSMKHMIDSYLDFARGESCEQFTYTEINEYIQEFFKLSRFQKTKLILGNDPIYAKIRRLSFTRALANLISNAEKYTSYAEVRCFTSNNKIIISIDDNGPGIATHERDLVFKAFYRSDKARDIGSGSVGLGLPITKEIILAHKGDIYIEDSGILSGARIVVIIPEAKKDEEV